MHTNFLTGVKVSPPSLMSQLSEGFTSVLPDRGLVVEHFKLIENGTIYYFFRTRRACFFSKEEYSMCKEISFNHYHKSLIEYQTRINESQAGGLQKYIQTTIWDFL